MKSVALPILAVLSVASVARAQAPSFEAFEASAPPLDGPERGMWVVDVADELDESAVAALAVEYGVTLVDNSPGVKHDGNVFLANVSASQTAAAMARLARDPRVEGVEEMAFARAFFTPNDPMYADQWHMTRVNAARAWDYGCGAGVTVAVIDTGVACYDQGGFTKGTDLEGTRCVPGYNFVGDNDLAADDQGHGTHVAGTIAQTTNNALGAVGLAHCANLMPVKVLSSQGWGSMADVAEGIRWAADHGAQVINLSLGSASRSGVVEKAVRYAQKAGVVVVAAAGNSGKSVGYPAAYEGVVAVSATDKNDAIAWFSSRGPQVAIGAPGVGVTQQTICEAGKNRCELWGVFNGTSMASPHVAAAAALLVGQGVTNPAHVRSILAATASPKEDATLFGAGILDAGRAAATTYVSHLALRLCALGALFLVLRRRLHRKNGMLNGGPAMWLGALWASVGVVPILPWTGLAARCGAYRWFADLSSRPLGEWDLLLSPSLHAWLPLASAAPALLLTALFFHARSARSFAGGVALGTAALLVQTSLSLDTRYALGTIGLVAFSGVNAWICMWIARISLDARE
jgi:serine protease